MAIARCPVGVMGRRFARIPMVREFFNFFKIRVRMFMGRVVKVVVTAINALFDAISVHF